MKLFLSVLIFFGLVFANTACGKTGNSNKAIPVHLLKFEQNSFAYPVGESERTSEARDSDRWYNAQDFGANRHLGEDWNANTGGNSDCGAPVYAAAAGRVVLAEDAGAGWGNVVIIEHSAANNTKVQTLYGHLETIADLGGTVAKREQIGTIGSANNRYLCHLHFELRWTDCPQWNKPGNGYGDERSGWVDPSEFIDRVRGTND